jgi:hypothetical protein
MMADRASKIKVPPKIDFMPNRKKREEYFEEEQTEVIDRRTMVTFGNKSEK